MKSWAFYCLNIGTFVIEESILTCMLPVCDF